ncbi:MAG TPA: cupin domain-containing protein [Bryobacteraceae bacterium]|nr:cupin domain-containing protein [Bryobacteraceae bacterium]
MSKRRDFLKTAGALSAASALFQQVSQGAGKLSSTVIEAGKATASKQNGQDLKIHFDGPTDQLKSMTTGSLLLQPGMQPHEPHQHPEEELMMITEGSGEIYMDGKTLKCSAGSIMYAAANKLHGIKNTGTKPLMFYFAKWKA